MRKGAGMVDTFGGRYREYRGRGHRRVWGQGQWTQGV